MSDIALTTAGAKVWNVPNIVTMSRLALSIVLFVLLSFDYYTASLVVFIIAASTDWINGYWARKYGQVTQLGRILDPFADKMIICGTFIFLAAAPQLADGSPASGVAGWVATLIMAREIGVTALRGFVESHGGDFSAKWAGKWKMVFQCLAACFSIGQLRYYDFAEKALVGVPDWTHYGLIAFLWIAIGLTVYSGYEYVVVAMGLIRKAD